MMKKRMVFGAITIVFLMLLIPQVNAIEYNQVLTTVKENMFRVDDYLEKNHCFNSIFESKGGQIKEIREKIPQNFERICTPCLNGYMYETCGELFIEFLMLNFLAFIFMMTLVLIPLSLLFFNLAQDVYHQAQNQGCLWAGG